MSVEAQTERSAELEKFLKKLQKRFSDYGWTTSLVQMRGALTRWDVEQGRVPEAYHLTRKLGQANFPNFKKWKSIFGRLKKDSKLSEKGAQQSLCDEFGWSAKLVWAGGPQVVVEFGCHLFGLRETVLYLGGLNEKVSDALLEVLEWKVRKVGRREAEADLGRMLEVVAGFGVPTRNAKAVLERFRNMSQLMETSGAGALVAKPNLELIARTRICKILDVLAYTLYPAAEKDLSFIDRLRVEDTRRWKLEAMRGWTVDLWSDEITEYGENLGRQLGQTRNTGGSPLRDFARTIVKFVTPILTEYTLEDLDEAEFTFKVERTEGLTAIEAVAAAVLIYTTFKKMQVQ
jgi:hypothetical protein